MVSLFPISNTRMDGALDMHDFLIDYEDRAVHETLTKP